MLQLSKSNGTKANNRSSRVNFIFFVCVLFFCVFSARANTNELLPNIAIIDLYNDALPEKEWSITGFLTQAMVNTQKYAVTKRSKVVQAIDELGLHNAQSAIEHASQIGKMLEAQKVVTGWVGFYSTKKNKRITHVWLTVNLIDVASGSIQETVTVEDKVKRNRRGFGITDASAMAFTKKALNDLLD